MLEAESDQAKTPPVGRDPTIDVLRGITIAAVTTYHLHADVRGLDGLAEPARAFMAAVASLDLRGALGSAAFTFAAAPAYRLDLFLFVTGLVLALAPHRPFPAFLKRRARDVLPHYWLGSVLVAGCLILLAIVRAIALHTPVAEEIHHGTRLARQRYLFESTDLLRSLSVVGRFQDARCFQVVAPSMWYVMLLLQTYLIYPGLRALRERLGTAGMLAAILAFTWAARAWVFRADPLPSFGKGATVLYLIPFRLGPVALGMFASQVLRALRPAPPDWVGWAATPAALGWLLITFWIAAGANRPGTVAGVIGPVAPLALGIPALWWLATTAGLTPGVGGLLVWAGQHSLSILVTQDVLRLAVGTWAALSGPLDRWLWPLLVPYLASCMALARLWDALVTKVRDLVWPE